MSMKDRLPTPGTLVMVFELYGKRAIRKTRRLRRVLMQPETLAEHETGGEQLDSGIRFEDGNGDGAAAAESGDGEASAAEGESLGPAVGTEAPAPKACQLLYLQE